MTANNGSDSDLIFLLGMVYAAGRAQPLMAVGHLPQPHRAQQRLQLHCFGVRVSYRPL